MIWLLDVSALVALGLVQHEFHSRVAQWVASQRTSTLATTPITELGFVRILAQNPAYGLTVGQTRVLLKRLKAARTFAFIPDDHDASLLPDWVKSPKQTTDGHLVRLAQANGAGLATLDRGIAGAYFIPTL